MQFASDAGHLCIGVQFGALQIYTYGFRSFYFSVSFRMVPFFELNLLLLCVFFVDSKASGIVFFKSFFSYAICSISSIIFCQLQRFFFHYFVP